MKRQFVELTFSGRRPLLAVLQSAFPERMAELPALIAQGSVWQENQRLKDSQHLLKGGDSPLSVWFTAYPIVEFTLDPGLICYEDETLLLVWKPAHVNTCQSVYADQDCLTHGVQKYLQGLGNKHQLNTINRLDRETSGLVVYGKNKTAEKALYKIFMDRQVHKRYLATCPARPDLPKRLHIRDSFEYQGKVVDAETWLRRLDSFSDQERFCYLALPQTGRTHQIRKHFLRYLLPIDGDSTYGGRTMDTLQLACVGYRFIHPASQKPLRLTVWPWDMPPASQ